MSARVFSLSFLLALSIATTQFVSCNSVLYRQPVDKEGEDVAFPDLWQSADENHGGAVLDGWVKSFEDSDLDAIIEEALAHNRNILQAAAQLKAAKEGTIISRAPLFPSLSANGSGSAGSVKVREAGDLSEWQNSENYSLSLNLSWEIDLWGRLRNLHQASEYDYEASVADFRAARLSLVANTAKSWMNLITAQKQVELAQKTLNSFQANFRITERNYKAGDLGTSALDVQFGRNNVASAERSLISRKLSRDEARRTLEILLGRYPAALIQGRNTLPNLPLEVPAGLPSELLMRRPDLIAAARDLKASAERALATKKSLLPSIRLTGSGSVTSDKLTELVTDPVTIARNIAASISQPIFEGGELAARARQSMHTNEALVQSFANLALRAFREVESALARDRSLKLQEQFLNMELNQANLAEEQASRQYSEGIVGILSVLEAQRRAVNARFAMISLQNERIQNRIDLHLALGGDFELPKQDSPINLETESPEFRVENAED